MRLSPTKVLLTVSPFRSFLFPPASVFSQRPLTRQPNFYAAWPSSAFSAACRLFVSLCSLFRTRFLCFHELADSFAKIPGGGTSAHPRHAFRRHMRHVPPLSPVASLDCAYFLSPRGVYHQRSFCVAATPIGSPFVFLMVQRPFRASPVYLHEHDRVGLCGVLVDSV